MSAKHGQANKDALLLYLHSVVPSGCVEPEHVFAKPRRWRFDFAVPRLKLAIEYDGVNTFGGHQGRHTSIIGISGDHEKLNTAALLGWKVLRFTKLHFSDRERKKHKLSHPLDALRSAIPAEALSLLTDP